MMSGAEARRLAAWGFVRAEGTKVRHHFVMLLGLNLRSPASVDSYINPRIMTAACHGGLRRLLRRIKARFWKCPLDEAVWMSVAASRT